MINANVDRKNKISPLRLCAPVKTVVKKYVKRQSASIAVGRMSSAGSYYVIYVPAEDNF